MEYILYIIKTDLESQKRYYDLDGVEITFEDAQNVLDLINQGIDNKKAIDQVLQGIRECLSQGWEY